MANALQAAVEAQQWEKAGDILDALNDSSVPQDNFKQLGRYYSTVKMYDKAEKYFLRGKLHMEVIKMHIHSGMCLLIVN